METTCQSWQIDSVLIKQKNLMEHEVLIGISYGR